MLSAVGFALIVAIEPLGIIAYIAILMRGGRRNTWGFIVGWMLCACVVALITVVFAGGTHQHDSVQHHHLGRSAPDRAGCRRAGPPGRSGARARDASTPDAPEIPEIPETGEDRRAGRRRDHRGLVQGWPVVAAAVAAVLKATDSERRAAARDRRGDRGVDVDVPRGPDPLRAASRTHRGLARRPPPRIESHRDRVIDWLLLGVGVWLVLHGVVVQLAK